MVLLCIEERIINTIGSRAAVIVCTEGKSRSFVVGDDV